MTNAFGGLAPPGPAGGASALPQTPSRSRGDVLLQRGEGGTGKGKGRGLPPLYLTSGCGPE